MMDRTGRQTEAIIWSVVMVILAAVFIVLRFVARKLRGMRLERDDWMEVISLILILGLLACLLIMIENGMGLHLATFTSKPPILRTLKTTLAFEILYASSIFAIKTSLLLMYSRMFPTRQMRNATLLLWTVSALLTISVIVVSIFQCMPIYKIWDPTVAGTCLNDRRLLIFTALPNVLTDFAILILPIRLIFYMEIRTNQKYILMLVFSSGCLFIVGSVTRFAILFRFNHDDFTYTLLEPGLWSVIEASLGVITGCIPTLAPLLQSLSKLFFSLVKSKDGSKTLQRTSSTEILSESPFDPISSKPRKLRSFPKGSRSFHRLDSSGGRDTPMRNGPMALEVKVTTTIDVIVSILSNDGLGPSTLLPGDERGVEMQAGGGFKHEYGPRSMNGWV